MVSVLLSAPKLILESPLVLTMDTSLVHHIVGAGSPVALQEKVTFPPSVVVLFRGWAVICGTTAIRGKKTLTYCKITCFDVLFIHLPVSTRSEKVTLKIGAQTILKGVITP